MFRPCLTTGDGGCYLTKDRDDRSKIDQIDFSFDNSMDIVQCILTTKTSMRNIETRNKIQTDNLEQETVFWWVTHLGPRNYFMILVLRNK
jgi:hypothetical protein